MINVVDEEKEVVSENEEDVSTEQEEITNEETVETEKKPGNWKKKIRRILNVVEWILLIVCMIVLIYIFSNTFSGKAASFFGTSILHVVTGSMEPTIPVDDFVIVKKTDVSSLEEKDIIAFYSENPGTEGFLVIHRIMSVNPDGSYVTKGDANTIEDAMNVSPDKIIGKYEGDAWFLNWLVSFVSLKKLLLMLVIIPMFLVSIYEVKTLAKLFKSETKGSGDESETEEEKIERLKREAIEEYKKTHEIDDPIIEASCDDKENQISEIDELVKKYGTAEEENADVPDKTED